MAITLANVKNLIGSILNATPNYGDFVTDADVLWHGDAIERAILDADKIVVETIISTPGHRSRYQYLTDTAVTNGGIIRGRIAGISIDGQEGKWVPLDTLQNNRNSTLTLTGTTRQYSTHEQKLYFIGSSATVAIVSFTPSSSPQAPDEYEYALVVGALSLVQVKEGAFMNAAGHWASLFSNMLQLIRSGAEALPPPVPPPTS